MNDTRALCPKCRNLVQFDREGDYNTCPVCGSRVRLARWGLESTKPYESEGEVVTVFKFVVKFLLIVAAMIVVGVAVLFAGCIFMLGRS